MGKYLSPEDSIEVNNTATRNYMSSLGIAAGEMQNINLHLTTQSQTLRDSLPSDLDQHEQSTGIYIQDKDGNHKIEVILTQRPSKDSTSFLVHELTHYKQALNIAKYTGNQFLNSTKPEDSGYMDQPEEIEARHNEANYILDKLEANRENQQVSFKRQREMININSPNEAFLLDLEARQVNHLLDHHDKEDLRNIVELLDLAKFATDYLFENFPEIYQNQPRDTINNMVAQFSYSAFTPAIVKNPELLTNHPIHLEVAKHFHHGVLQAQQNQRATEQPVSAHQKV